MHLREINYIRNIRSASFHLSKSEKNHSRLRIVHTPFFLNGPRFFFLNGPTCRQQWCEDSRLGLAGMAEMVVDTPDFAGSIPGLVSS